MNIIILGCGRVGATLATLMDEEGHQVTIIDSRSEAFTRLSNTFKGDTLVGNGTDEDVLRQAGIEHADVFAAATNGDNRNIMSSQIAKTIFGVPKVICRIYDPIRTEAYKDIGLETICPTTVGAALFREAIVGKQASLHQVEKGKQ